MRLISADDLLLSAGFQFSKIGALELCDDTGGTGCGDGFGGFPTKLLSGKVA
jgi:hypothetical protein